MSKDKKHQKIKSLFQFLKQYNNVKNPTIAEINSQIWSMWIENIPEHEKIKSNIHIESLDNDCILSVGKAEFTECPKIKEDLKVWIEKGWNDFKCDLKLIEEIKSLQLDSKTGEEIIIVERFEDDKNRVLEFNKWKEKREVWIEKEKKTEEVNNIFNKLYELYSKINKESETLELVFGDGILAVNEERHIYHPVLIQAVKLNFDYDNSEFKIEIADKGPELYKSLISLLSDSNIELLIEIYKEFEREEISPFDINNTNSFLNRLSNALSSNGKFIRNEEDIRITNNPIIFRKPVLFIRKRNIGFSFAIDSILEDLEEVEYIPHFLQDIIGEDYSKENESEKDGDNSKLISSNGLDENILLTKPANQEQLLVAKRLKNNAAVLVQGPPGTGKTHTISNIIGHLLSEGKSILVTSYSDKALSVLKEKVVDNLQALCLSLLSTNESRIEMEKTLDVINENRSRLDKETLNKSIISLEKERKDKIDKLKQLKLDLKNARLNEYRPLVIGGEEFTPKEAAKFINKNKNINDWIPEPVEKGMSLSLTKTEIEELYFSNKNIKEEDEIEFDSEIPQISELITPIEFNNLISAKNSFKKEELDYGIDFWNNSENYDEEVLKNIKDRINNAICNIDIDKTWTLEIIENAKEEILKKNWINLIKNINEVYNISLESSGDIINYNPEFKEMDETINPKVYLDLIINKLNNGEKIRRYNLILDKKLKLFINSCRVNGKIPSNLEEYKALDTLYKLKSEREKLKNKWNIQMGSLGAETTEFMGIDFEKTMKKYVPIIEENLKWYEITWNSITQDLNKIGFKLNKINNNIDLSSDKYSDLKYIKNNLSPIIIKAIDSQNLRLKYKNIKENKEKIEKIINKYTSNTSSKIVSGLQIAIMNENIELYKEKYEDILKLNEISTKIIRRRELIKKLSKTSKSWANEITLRNDKFGEEKAPNNIEDAWKFVQFSQEIKERNLTNIEKIQNDILEIEKSLRENTTKLAFDKAWLYKLKSFDDNKEQVRAIEGWRQLVRKIGQGKGKNAEKFKSEARKLMPQCQGAVPVWIMPLNKVVENFNPKENKFDVVIIDEASQADVMAIVALYLGKKVIIVGDNEQVSPLAIGEKIEEVDNLAMQYLSEIPNSKLYGGKLSIYDLAQFSGYQPVRLKEHFRCVPEIIQYSNLLSYNGQIRALRDTSQVKTKPPIITYRVENAIEEKKTNKKEIEAIVSLILACCEQKEYDGKTFGVITLKGEKQADLIDKELQKRMELKEYNKRKILCGNSANFQGDERDIIFLSMVDSNDKEGPLRLQGYGVEDSFKKRYNVAVSRAKDQLWLVHSLDSENDLKKGDIRKELLDYCNNYKSRQIEYEKNVINAESEFEKRVMKYLIEKGYNITPQWEVGSFRIDMVASYRNNRIAIECDGERWHGEDKLEEDMNRQAILERLGWRFIRIRGSEFFKDEVQTMSRVYDRLNELDIYPEYSNNKQEEENELKNRIILRAQEIKEYWETILL